jgi:hypothetical protein
VKRITRNKLLIWVIVLGLANFIVYTFFYWYFQGDARNGFINDGEYYLRGHFIHSLDGKPSEPVSRAKWIYSFIHSISIWPTIGAVLASMLILARPHIIATMKSDSWLTGRMFVNACLALVTIVTLASTALFLIDLMRALDAAALGRDYGI